MKATASQPTPQVAVPKAVQAFLDGIQTGRWDSYGEALDEKAFYDGTMPGWRMRFSGRQAVARETARDWTGRNTWRIVEQNVERLGDTVVVDFEIKGRRAAPDHPGHAHQLTCRIANIFRLRGDRILEHRYFCSGEWPDAVVREIERSAPKAVRPSA